MRRARVGYICGMIALSLIAGAAAYGQKGVKGQKGQKGQAKHAQAMLARLPVDAIDAAVKLTSEQKAKITAIHDKFEADAKALHPAKGAAPDPANRQKMLERSRQASSEIEAVLTSEQRDKLKSVAGEMAALQHS